MISVKPLQSSSGVVEQKGELKKDLEVAEQITIKRLQARLQ